MSPLLLIVAYNFALSENLSNLQRVELLRVVHGRDRFISAECFKSLWNLFHTARRRVVTHHVIAEAYGLAGRLDYFRRRKASVLETALSLFRLPGIEERSCSLEKLEGDRDYRKILRELGPADAGVMHTAENLKATIVTDDSRLASWAERHSVRTLQVISLAPKSRDAEW